MGDALPAAQPHLVAGFDVLVQQPAQLVVVGIPLEGLVSPSPEKALPVLRRTELLCAAR